MQFNIEGKKKEGKEKEFRESAISRRLESLIHNEDPGGGTCIYHINSLNA
jgi:hypothetical protein